MVPRGIRHRCGSRHLPSAPQIFRRLSVRKGRDWKQYYPHTQRRQLCFGDINFLFVLILLFTVELQDTTIKGVEELKRGLEYLLGQQTDERRTCGQSYGSNEVHSCKNCQDDPYNICEILAHTEHNFRDIRTGGICSHYSHRPLLVIAFLQTVFEWNTELVDCRCVSKLNRYILPHIR